MTRRRPGADSTRQLSTSEAVVASPSAGEAGRDRAASSGCGAAAGRGADHDSGNGRGSATPHAEVSLDSGRSLSPGDRAARGKQLRAEVPRESHAEFAPPPDRPDPIALLEEQARSRLPELVPVRWGRMTASPFAYYRGAALPMASDLAATPVTGLAVQACGDAHLSNFGIFGSAERRRVFDVNDFDETLRDWKFSVDIASMVPVGLEMYGGLCGWTLARADARSVDRIAIAAYLGRSDVFDRAVAAFAAAYAYQNERDYRSLVDAVAAGRITAQPDT